MRMLLALTLLVLSLPAAAEHYYGVSMDREALVAVDADSLRTVSPNIKQATVLFVSSELQGSGPVKNVRYFKTRDEFNCAQRGASRTISADSYSNDGRKLESQAGASKMEQFAAGTPGHATWSFACGLSKKVGKASAGVKTSEVVSTYLGLVKKGAFNKGKKPPVRKEAATKK